MKKYLTREIEDGFLLSQLHLHPSSIKVERKYFESLSFVDKYINEREACFSIEVESYEDIRIPGEKRKSRKCEKESYTCPYQEFFRWYSEEELNQRTRIKIKRNGLEVEIGKMCELTDVFRLYGEAIFYQRSAGSAAYCTDSIKALESVLVQNGSLYVSGPIQVSHIVYKGGQYSSYGIEASSLSSLLYRLNKIGSYSIDKKMTYKSGIRNATLKMGKVSRKNAILIEENGIKSYSNAKPNIVFAYHQITETVSGENIFIEDECPVNHLGYTHDR